MTRLLPSLPDWFRSTPAGRQAVQEAAAADDVEFRRLGAELAALNAEEEATGKQRAAALRKAEGEFTKAKDAFEGARKRLGDLRAASLGASSQYDSRRTQLQGGMQTIGNELAEAFIRELRAEHAKLRKPDAVSSVEVLTTDRTDGLPMRIDVSNSRSVGARLVALVHAIRQAEALRYFVGDTAAEIQKLRASLPAVKSAQDEAQGVLAAAAQKVGRTIRTAHDRVAARLLAYAERDAQAAEGVN